MKNKAEYFGNCIHSFDEDGDSLIPLFNDINEFAFADENAIEIDFYKFIEITKLSKYDLQSFHSQDNIYLLHQPSNSAFIYNKEQDIHQIFKVNNKEINMSNSPLDKVIKIENYIKEKKAEGYHLLFHSGDKSKDDELKYGIEPQFGEWLTEVLSGSIDMDDESFVEEIIENDHNQTCFFSEDPSWVSIKAQRAAKSDGFISDTSLKTIIEHGQLCIILTEADEDNEEFKRAGYRSDDYVEKSTYLFSDEIADYELPFGVERGDIYSHDVIEPEFTLTGVELAGFLARNYPKANLMKDDIRDIFKEYPEFDNTEPSLKQDIEKLMPNVAKDPVQKRQKPKL